MARIRLRRDSSKLIENHKHHDRETREAAASCMPERLLPDIPDMLMHDPVSEDEKYRTRKLKASAIAVVVGCLSTYLLWGISVFAAATSATFTLAFLGMVNDK